jgi:putative transposase
MPTDESASRTQRYQPTQRQDEDRLTRAIVELASHYGRYGCQGACCSTMGQACGSGRSAKISCGSRSQAHPGRTVRMLNLIDEYSRERLMICCERSWTSAKVISTLWA